MAAAQCTTAPPDVTPDVPISSISRLPWGLLTVPNRNGWKPKNERSQPPGSLLMVAPAEIVTEFALAYNRSQYAREHRRWAVVSGDGALLILVDIPAADRPDDPGAFPEGTRIVSAYQAKDLAAAENAERYRLASVPREWTVVLRPLVTRQTLSPEGSGPHADPRA